MTVTQLSEWQEIHTLSLQEGERQITGVYIGDLLSWVMGRAPADAAWITIMSNANVAAVATLADTACVILAEDVQPDEQLLTAARTRNINLFSSPLTAYQLALRLGKAIEDE